MSSSQLPDRPAFQSLEDEGISISDSAPMSKLAIGVFVTGLFSLFTLVSYVLLPVAIVAIVMGAVEIIRISRDKALSGVWFAQIGFGLGVMSLVGSVAANRAEADHLLTHAEKFAKVYLGHLANGEPYKAMMLQNPESERQLMGTNLKEFYESQNEGFAEDMKARFINAPENVMVMQEGADADWQLFRQVEIKRTGIIGDEIQIEMYNTKKPQQKVKIMLRRATGSLNEQQAGFWQIPETSLGGGEDK